MNNPVNTRLTGRSNGLPELLGTDRVRAHGKFLFVGERKFWVKGVTYGTFRPSEDGHQFPPSDTVARDFATIAANGFNTVRTYTIPPRWLLDAALRNGLRVMVGLPWEQHITFLDDKKLVAGIESRVRQGVKTCAGHPAVFCYTVGNEIPASIVRWHGRRRIEHFIERLYRIAKQEDPEALVSYVNFPTTEYLQLPFLDLLCFNVYLESRDKLDDYLARLQNLAGERPLLMAEIGLDSRRNGVEQQAGSLDWQVRTAFAAGCAGAFVFAWTDEWYRGGYDIEDWDFGLTTRDRLPKPALGAVRKAFSEVPFPAGTPWPRVSVVVCSYNGSRTIRETLEGLKQLDYPNFEVIVVNDGSTDATPDIAGEYDVKLISTENRGLSNARNTGWQEATGEIVAYIDDDAYPDPHWLQYLAHAFMTTEFVGVGGPNFVPPGDGPIAECVYNAPGGPIHVLISDREAEHIPGCNMAFRRSAMQAIDGFDPRYRAAGDDVDICWRLQDRGGTIGFQPAAMVWHHRRNSFRMYWKQQQGYGKAEALLEEKWPERYNAVGHLTWSGRLYGKGLTLPLRLSRWQIYHGVWGTAPFQSLYEPAPDTLLSLPLMPEWYLIVLFLAGLSLLGTVSAPLLCALPLLAIAILAPVGQAMLSAARASFTSNPRTATARLKLRGLTMLLHLVQPLARLKGRLQHGLKPWRQRVTHGFSWPWPRTSTLWSESWQAPEDWLRSLRETLKTQGAVVFTGGNYDHWDLTVRGGLFGALRTRMAIEEHGAGRQMLRFRSWPKLSQFAVGAMLLFAALAIITAFDKAWLAAALLAGSAIAVAAQSIASCAAASDTWLSTLGQLKGNQAVLQTQVDILATPKALLLSVLRKPMSA